MTPFFLSVFEARNVLAMAQIKWYKNVTANFIPWLMVLKKEVKRQSMPLTFPLLEQR